MKVLVAIISFIVGVAISGCGGGGSSSSNNSPTQESTTQTNNFYVVVERGPVYDANVTDANGSIATQIAEGNNTYQFENQPHYPIKAEGGFIDVDGDGNMTEAVDIPLDINLTSYSDIITPTTTFLSDDNETVRQELLTQLANECNCSEEELLKLPSKATKKSIYVLNAVYEKLMDRNNSKSNAPNAIKAIIDRAQEFENNDNTDINATSQEVAKAIEEMAISNLNAKGLIKKLSSEDILEIQENRKNKGKGNSKKDKESTTNIDSNTSSNEESNTGKKEDGNSGNNGKGNSR